MSIKHELGEIIEARKKIHTEDPYWDTSAPIKAEIELFTRNLPETVAFLDNDCTADQLSWMSEIFDEISAKLQSWEFIDALYRAAKRFPKEAEEYHILECIPYAEGQLSDEVYQQRHKS